MSQLKTDKLSPRTGSGTVTLGTSGDTFSIPSGVTLANSGTATGFGSSAIVVVHMSTSQGFAKDVWEKIDFDTEVFDTNGEYSTTDKRFTPTTAGYYLFSMSLCKDDGESQVNNIYTGVYKNGSLYKSQKILGNYPYYQVEHFIPIFQTIVYCNGSSDYLEPWFSWGANGTLELDVYPDSLTTGKTELTIAKVD
jgi:hypothetical protein